MPTAAWAAWICSAAPLSLLNASSHPQVVAGGFFFAFGSSRERMADQICDRTFTRSNLPQPWLICMIARPFSRACEDQICHLDHY
jgi:hypothetical protein